MTNHKEMSAEKIERFLELLTNLEMELYKSGLLTLEDMWW